MIQIEYILSGTCGYICLHLTLILYLMRSAYVCNSYRTSFNPVQIVTFRGFQDAAGLLLYKI